MGLLRGVIDPELGSDIVDLGMARQVTVSPQGEVNITIALTTSGCPLRAQIQRDARARVIDLPGVTRVRFTWAELNAEEKAAAMAKARWNVAQDAPDTEIPITCRVLMVASGKGGVGKSSVTVNLAASLAHRGFTVGVMDADIWGYSVPRMLGAEGRLEANAEKGQITPQELPCGDGRIKIVSMGFLVDNEETALMWRGLMLNRAVQHFCQDVTWGALDYLLIDMPPGTGDVQMGLAKMLPRAEMIVVTTPALAAQKVAVRVANMGRANYLRVVGVIENMSAYITDDGQHHALFGVGGGSALAEDIGAPLLGSIPLDASVASGGDTGQPVALGAGPAAEAYQAIVELLVTEAAPPLDMAGCSARLLDAASAALDEAGL
jgi:ATP-binding protein involved in chromosome partitioning